MTKAKRSIWAGANRDLAATNHGRMSRRGASIPTAGVDAATRLEAVKAAASRKHPTKHPERIQDMHQAIRNDLIAKLRRLTADERQSVFDEAAAENQAEEGMTRAAEGLRDLLGHSAPKAGTENV